MLSENYKFNKKTTKELLQSNSTYASVLLAIVLATIQDDEVSDLAELDPELLFTQLEEEFNCKLPEENENKINAAITALTTDLFWTSFNVSKAIAMAFDDGDIGDIIKGEEEEVDACPLLWALLEVGIINGMSLIESIDQCSPIVIGGINRILDSEAEEKNIEADELQEIGDEPYYHKYLSQNVLQLVSQFIKLGVDNSIANELLDDYISSMQQL